jgi:2-amino-4-hydroxy-6-hydroxymethyldihydropteridine diphosphokinase
VARAFVGLGSNLQDPARQLDLAFDRLDRIPATRLARRSRLYRTPPWGELEQPEFVNAVAELATELPASELLRQLQAIENDTGRQRARKWGPRVLDLDLLLYGDLRDGDASVDDGVLRLPHPHLHERAFVLVPLAELAPDLLVPGLAARVVDLLARVDRDGIEALG